MENSLMFALQFQPIRMFALQFHPIRGAPFLKMFSFLFVKNCYLLLKNDSWPRFLRN